MLARRFFFVTCLTGALAVCATNAWSHAKTDVITVANGDQITGAVNEMTAGKLSLGTSYAGTVKIKWREVRQIDSRYVYEVRLDDGERIYGRFAANDIPNQLTFRSGDRSRQLEIDDIVEIRSIEEELADKLDLQLSTTINADPHNQTLTLQANGSYDVRGGKTRFLAQVNDTKTIAGEGENREETTSNASKISITREFWRERGTAQSFRLFNAVYSTNDDLGIRHRGSLGVGVGRYLINNLGNELSVSTGLQATQERRLSCDGDESGSDLSVDTMPIDPDYGNFETCDTAEMFFTLSWHLYRFQNLDMDISVLGNAYPSLSDWGRVRGDMNILISWELFDNFYWTVNARSELDTAGDRDDALLSTSDYNLTTGVTWKY